MGSPSMKRYYACHRDGLSFSVMNDLVQPGSPFAVLVFTGLNEFCMATREIIDNINNKDTDDML